MSQGQTELSYKTAWKCIYNMYYQVKFMFAFFHRETIILKFILWFYGTVYLIINGALIKIIPWKVSEIGVFMVRIFFWHLDWIQKFTPEISVFSTNKRKYGTEKLQIRILFTQWMIQFRFIEEKKIKSSFQHLIKICLTQNLLFPCYILLSLEM